MVSLEEKPSQSDPAFEEIEPKGHGGKIPVITGYSYMAKTGTWLKLPLEFGLQLPFQSYMSGGNGASQKAAWERTIRVTVQRGKGTPWIRDARRESSRPWNYVSSH